MDTQLPGDVTRVLRRLNGENREAVGSILPLVYDELHRIAARQMTGERAGHSLQPTALVHEAYMRLAVRQHPHWDNRLHFYRAAAVVMRSILVNHARDRRRLKRGGARRRVPLDDATAVFEERAVDLIALDEALERLIAMAPRQAEIVELRFFGGLSVPATAELLGVSERTVQADWGLARAWLRRELQGA